MRKTIEFFGTKYQFESDMTAIEASIKQGLLGASLYKSEVIAQFEQRLGNYLERKYVVTTGSCSDALAFSLSALELEPGSEVLVPAFSFIASASCVLRAGLVPVFVDLDRTTMCMNLDAAEKQITPRTKALVFAHLFGAVQNHDEIAAFCERHGLYFIEDFAQAFAPNLPWKPKRSTVTCLSFNPTKVFGGIENGGAVVTDEPEIAEKVRQWTYHGRIGSEEPSEFAGHVSLLTSMNAHYLMWKLDRFEDVVAKRLEILCRYSEGLRGLSGVTLVCDEKVNLNGHKVSILTERRDELKKYLAEHGVATRVHYARPLPYEPLFKNFVRGSYPEAEWVSSHILSLPIHTGMTSEDVDYIVDLVSRFFECDGGKA